MGGATLDRVLGVLLVVAAVPGCASRFQAEASASAAILVYETPPAPKSETAPPAPSEAAVWVEGHWRWTADDASWAWVSGHWIPPRPGHVYVQPRWERRGRGWMFIRGHWHRVDPG